jgi:general stress protein CsbA
VSKRSPKKAAPVFGRWEFSRTNYLIFLAGILDIFLAYAVMATGETNSFQSLTLAPIMLVIGYVVIIPLAILYKPGRRTG